MRSNRHWIALLALGLAVSAWLMATSAHAGEESGAEALVRAVSSDVLEAVKADPEMQRGDLAKVMTLVDARVMPHVDMARLTGVAMGRHWRLASEAQKSRLQEEFKMLLVRSYAGALSLVDSRQTVEVRPGRAAPDAVEVTVATRIRGRGDPVPIDYRLYRTDTGWLIYDVSFLGIWLAENYRNSFADAIGAVGIDGLIDRLHARNHAKNPS